MDQDRMLRKQLVKLLQGKGAHVTFDAAIKDFPEATRGKTTESLPYTAWQLLEHMRIAQWDILEFSKSADHVSPEWPTEYWPKELAPPDGSDWQKSIEAFQKDLKEMQDLISDPEADLYKKFPHGTGQTLFREALVLADHNAYHTGQIVLLRKLLGIW